MSQDQFTEVSRKSWFSRLKEAVKGIIIGLILFIAAFFLLFWNEGRAVKDYKTLKEGAGSVVSAPADQVDPAREGRLIHLSGKAVTEEILRDPDFGVTANALRLERAAEMYQWQERSESKTEKKLGGAEETTTTYSYSKAWSESLISSSGFRQQAGHENPGAMPFSSAEQTARQVTLGAFSLPPSLVGKISNFESLPVSADAPLPENAAGRKVWRHGSGFYLGADPNTPQIGDLRISFQIVPQTEVSVVARQSGSSLEPYQSKAGGSIELLQTGTHSAAAMFESAQQSSQMLTWLLRLGGFILMLIGLSMMFKVLSVTADILPIFGNLVGAGTGLISFLLAAVFSLLTIAAAWVIYRPLIGLSLLAAAAALIWAVRGRFRAKRPAAAMPPPLPR
ncbi:MAG: TMEM43 family protein [Candidatus Electronema sp. V4]|uniref:TMEM43 family protein n=1 Tax=Candidatus Electronema sp. V4 TaxID=3454756 RepID=UPI004055389F